MRLEGKVCLITGGAAGIGRATAARFMRDGANVVIVDRDGAAIRSTVDALIEEGSLIHGYELDVTDRTQIAQVTAEIATRFGRIDVLVNNAGITRDARLQQMTEHSFDEVIDVNLKGAFNCTQAVVDQMVERGSGVILNASSVIGLFGNFGQTNYAASKFGVIGFTKTWAREFGPKGVRVNAVCPGFIATEMIMSIPENVLEKFRSQVWMRRLGKPGEVAGLYAFLASDDASYVNGAVIEVSGGVSI